jgi:hypothetical protein
MDQFEKMSRKKQVVYAEKSGGERLENGCLADTPIEPIQHNSELIAH